MAWSNDLLPMLATFVLGMMTADVVFDNVATPEAALSFYQTIIPSFALTIVVPAVLGAMALCVVHANLAPQQPQLQDRLIALFFGVAAPYFGVVVLPAENALLSMKNTRDAGFARAMATITTGHFVLVGLAVASLVLLYLRPSSHAKRA